MSASCSPAITHNTELLWDYEWGSCKQWAAFELRPEWAVPWHCAGQKLPWTGDAGAVGDAQAGRDGTGQPEGHGGSPSPGHGAPPWGWGRQRLGQALGLWVGLAWQSPQPGQAGLCLARARPCCGVTRARTDGSGCWHGVLSHGQGGGSPGGLGKGRQSWRCPQRPGR